MGEKKATQACCSINSPSFFLSQLQSRDASALDSRVVKFRKFAKLASLFHVAQNVPSTNQLALNVNLWIGRPFREHFQALTKRLVAENIEETKLKTRLFQNFNCTTTEATPRRFHGPLSVSLSLPQRNTRTFHENDHLVSAKQATDFLFDLCAKWYILDLWWRHWLRSEACCAATHMTVRLRVAAQLYAALAA